MKICLLTYRGNPFCGGQGIYAMHIASGLADLGHEVHMIQGPPYHPPVKGVHLHNIENHNYFNNKKRFIHRDRPFASFGLINLYEFIASKFGVFPEIEAFSIRAYFKLRELTGIHNFDIIHDNQCLGYGFLLIKTLGIPFVSTIHHPLTVDRSIWFEYPSSFSLKVKRVLYYPLIMQGYVSRRMDGIITVSESSATDIEKAFKVKKNKISVVYNGLDAHSFKPLNGLKKKNNSIIFVGNVEDRKKGIIYLLKAMTLARNSVNLTVVDGGSPNRNYVLKWIDSFGLNGRVWFTGKIDEKKLVELYSTHQIAVCPSLYEGFGFPAVEAMASGLPLIASDAGALPEVTGHHLETGYIVASRDSYGLADAIDYLIDHPAERKRIGDAARKSIMERFTWRNAAEETLKIYGEVINAYRGF